MIDESTGNLNDLLKILENVNFKGTNFKMPDSIIPVAIHNQTGNTLGTYSQLKMIKCNVHFLRRPHFPDLKMRLPDTHLIFFDSSLIFSVKVSSSTSSTSISGLLVG